MAEYADLIGTPFVSGGRSKEEGLDCYGLVKEMFGRYGQNIPEYDEDFKDISCVDQLIKREAENRTSWQRIDKPCEPCLIAIRFGVAEGLVNHVGCYIGNGRFIHTRRNIGICVERLDSPAWRKVIVGYYKFVGGE